MKALGSLADVERELRAAGFFEGGGDGLVADVYLGYGLSRALRRTDVPDPPEPCPLPAAAVGIRREDEPAPPAGAFRVGEWRATWDEGAYGSAVWVLLGFRTVNLVTDFADTLVLTAVMYKEPIEGKRYVDIAENSGYWDFIVRRQRNRRQRNRRQRNRPKSGVILRGRRLMP